MSTTRRIKELLMLKQGKKRLRKKNQNLKKDLKDTQDKAKKRIDELTSDKDVFEEGN